MAKRSRGRVTREPAPAQTTQRVQRTRPRRAVRRTADQPLFERYRSLIIGGIALAGFLIIGFLFLQGATSSAYACRDLLTPGPSEPIPTPRPATPTPTLTPSPTPAASPSATTGSPSPTSGESPSASPAESPSASPSASPTEAPSPTARLGFTIPDQGAFHVRDPGVTITYDYCPPGSGDHYNIGGANPAPMQPAVHQPTQERSPGYWVHNLEHGYTIVAYRCPSGQLGVGDCISQAEFEQLEQFFETSPAPHVSSCPTKALVVRFDQMSTDFAVLAWNRALLMDEFDLDKAVTFAEQWTEHVGVPEPLAC